MEISVYGLYFGDTILEILYKSSLIRHCECKGLC